jgi:3-methylcrotonyl-CoA carboxylase alpha subunit
MKWMVRGTVGAREVDVERSTDGFEVVLDGRTHKVDLLCVDREVASLRFIEDGRSFEVSFLRTAARNWRVGVREREFDLQVLTPVEAIDEGGALEGFGPSRIEAPIPGKVVAIKVKPGDEVQVGDALVVLEAMKMENELMAEQNGRVAEVHVAAGSTVDAGQILVELE